jgi:hypothetical protein
VKRADQVQKYQRRKESNMDKKINAIKKEAKHEVKQLGSLAKMDKKRDKKCEMGAKMMAKKGK